MFNIGLLYLLQKIRVPLYLFTIVLIFFRGIIYFSLKIYQGHKAKIILHQVRIQDFKLGGGAHLKKLCRVEGGTNILGVFRVKNHDFRPKNHIFSILGGRAPGAPSPESAPVHYKRLKILFSILSGKKVLLK